MRDYMRVAHPHSPLPNLFKPTFIINPNNPLIASIYQMGRKDPI